MFRHYTAKLTAQEKFTNVYALVYFDNVYEFRSRGRLK